MYIRERCKSAPSAVLNTVQSNQRFLQAYRPLDHVLKQGMQRMLGTRVTIVLVRVQATDTSGADQSSASRRSRFKEGLSNLVGKSGGNSRSA